jgi:hypothetical protein
VRKAVLLTALGLAALAGWWHFASEEETVQAQPASPVAQLPINETGRPQEARSSRLVWKTSGLQTTVPDTLGYDERAAVFALEQGGFRVRVMNHEVSRVSEEGVVVQQLPRGGVTRRVGWIVTIVVGRLR